MNKGLKGILIALSIVSCSTAASADVHYDRSNLDVGLSSVMLNNVVGYTTYHELIGLDNDKLLGGNLCLSGVYGRSTNPKHIAKNFGVNGMDYAIVYDGALNNLNANALQTVGDLLLHRSGGTTTIAGKPTYSPKQTAYGARLDYYQKLDKLMDGLYLGAMIKFLHVTNDMNMKVENAVDQLQTGKKNVTLNDLLTGNKIDFDNAANRHTELKYHKMCSNSATGLSDLDVFAGWNFLDGKKYHAGFNLGLVLPTASEGDIKYRWVARTGDKKLGFRAAADASAILWQEGDQNLKLNACVLYKYLTSGTEKRTLGLKELRYADSGGIVQTIKNPVLSPYYLVGKVGTIGLQPLANVTTFDVKVKAHNQLEGQIAFAYNHGNFTLDLGYNMLWKQARTVSLKPTCTFNNVYGVRGNTDYDATADAFTTGDTLAGDSTGLISKCDLDLYRAGAASQSVHTIFGGAGYTAKDWEYPVTVGVGVAYDLPWNNIDALSGYSLWAKAGIAF